MSRSDACRVDSSPDGPLLLQCSGRISQDFHPAIAVESAHVLQPSLRDFSLVGTRIPKLKHWAIVKCPFGTREREAMELPFRVQMLVD